MRKYLSVGGAAFIRSTILYAIAAATAAGTLSAQTASRGLALDFDIDFAEHEAFVTPPLHGQRTFVVIRLEENRLYLVEDGEPVWSAPVGTGTGFTLEADGRSWEFDTPRGVFRVQYKEKDPVWIKPDWAYIRDGLPVPPLDSPERRQVGMLGSTALYIGYELALHGTDRPELVLAPNPEERRISHGCIRMTNEDARTLFHRVEVGTPVLIF